MALDQSVCPLSQAPERNTMDSSPHSAWLKDQVAFARRAWRWSVIIATAVRLLNIPLKSRASATLKCVTAEMRSQRAASICKRTGSYFIGF